MKPDLSYYHRKLLALRERVAQNMQGLADETKPAPAGDGNLSGPIDDLADVSARKVDEALTLELAATEAQLAEAIEAALDRMEHGVFGLCESCGKSIARERLNAVPYAANCIRCARERQAVA